MDNEEPLEIWTVPIKLSKRELATRQLQAKASLDKLTQILDNPPPPPKKANLSESGINPFFPPIRLLDRDRERAQQLYWRVVEQGGMHKQWVEEGLLSLIAVSSNLDSLPFFEEALKVVRPRDQFSTQRKRLAMAAIAFVALRSQGPEAFDTLLRLAHQPDPDVRANAVYYIGKVVAQAEISSDILAQITRELQSIATKDPMFNSRFQARLALATLDQPIPMDNPKGVYAFKVKFAQAKKINRTIELRSNQTLLDLHSAIQHAIDWDDDHLYTFYMNGKLRDERYEIPCPDVRRDNLFGIFTFGGTSIAHNLLRDAGLLAEKDMGEEDEEKPLKTSNAVMGELGLVPGHKFLYYFDFGDSHEFEVEVVAIKPNAEPGIYPRVTDQQGEAPAQYAYWAEEDEEDY